MPRFNGLLSSLASSAGSSTHSLNGIEEQEQLEHALAATMYILDDDMERAEHLLNTRDSAFHKLGRSTVAFMRAVLGMEHDSMKTASDLIVEAENAASSEQRHARTNNKAFHSTVYAPGAEYSLCLAEAQVQSAIVGILNESVTEAVKGFYKIRKAYIALEAIVQSEYTYVKRPKISTLGPQVMESKDRVETGFLSKENPILEMETTRRYAASVGTDSDDNDDFFEAPEVHISTGVSSIYLGNIEVDGQPKNTDGLSGISDAIYNKSPVPSDSNGKIRQLSVTSKSPDISNTLNAIDFTTPLDIFIHSGASLYFGMLQLMLSLVPPRFSKLLSIVGFRGDRNRGLDMLWQATAYDNVNGAVASLVILGFYSGLVSSLDILPSSGPGAVPWRRCQTLVKELRLRHPNSQLILMQDVRMMTAERQLERAVDMLNAAPPSKLKQIEALQSFENALNCMFLHRYQACADSFLHCLELNNWSKALYNYIAGCAHVELYRSYKYGSRISPSISGSIKASSLNIKPDTARAARHAKIAKHLLHVANGHTGKQRIFARQLPFDVFVARKVAKWTTRATAWDVELVDAVGVSPIEEMILFWGGFGRMSGKQLEESLQRLEWSDGGSNPWWKFESLDEQAALWVLRAIVYRHLDRILEAKVMLRDEVINRHRWEEFRTVKNADTWPAPVARYELAVCYWLESEEGRKGALGGTATAVSASRGESSGRRQHKLVDEENALSNRESLQQCAHWLEQVARWDAYDLDVRFGTRITTGKETLAKLNISGS